MRCIVLMSSGLRNLISAMPAGSSTPPRACSAAYISMHLGLIVESMTTHAPPRISQCGGMYTMIGWRNCVSSSTMYEPNLSTCVVRRRR